MRTMMMIVLIWYLHLVGQKNESVGEMKEGERDSVSGFERSRYWI